MKTEFRVRKTKGNIFAKRSYLALVIATFVVMAATILVLVINTIPM